MKFTLLILAGSAFLYSSSGAAIPWQQTQQDSTKYDWMVQRCLNIENERRQLRCVKNLLKQASRKRAMRQKAPLVTPTPVEQLFVVDEPQTDALDTRKMLDRVHKALDNIERECEKATNQIECMKAEYLKELPSVCGDRSDCMKIFSLGKQLLEQKYK